MNERSATKIVIHYDDGSTKELDKGLAFHFGEVDEDENMTVTADMVNMGGQDLFLIVSAAVELGMKLGMFNDGEDDE